MSPYKFFVFVCAFLLGYGDLRAQEEVVSLGHVKLSVGLDREGMPVYQVSYGGRDVILP